MNTPIFLLKIQWNFKLWQWKFYFHISVFWGTWVVKYEILGLRERDSQMSRATITSLFFILGFMAWLSEYSYANVKSLVYNKNDKGGLFG